VYGAKSLSNGNVPWAAGKHPGLDLVCTTDTNILAIRGGKVISSNGYGDWGQHVVIEQDDGLFCIYAHMSTRFYAVGDRVERGRRVGIMGSTGQVTAAHLHIELQSKYYDAFSHRDMARYLNIANQLGSIVYLN